MKRKDRVLIVKTDELLETQTKTVAASLDMSVSQFTREALREKINRVARGRKPSTPVLDFMQTDKLAA